MIHIFQCLFAYVLTKFILSFSSVLLFVAYQRLCSKYTALYSFTTCLDADGNWFIFSNTCLHVLARVISSDFCALWQQYILLDLDANMGHRTASYSFTIFSFPFHTCLSIEHFLVFVIAQTLFSKYDIPFIVVSRLHSCSSFCSWNIKWTFARFFTTYAAYTQFPNYTNIRFGWTQYVTC